MATQYKHYLQVLPAGLFASLLLHLLIFTAAVKWVLIPVAEDTESHAQKQDETSYYFYQPARAVSHGNEAKISAKAAAKQLKAPAFDLSKTALKPRFDHAAQSQTLLQSKKAVAREDQEYLEPLRLIGEKLLDDPFRKLLGLAISRQLFYPRIARELFLHGTVGVGFTLFPNGDIQNVHVVKSSRERVLDQAAVQAVKNASPMQNVDIYLHEPRDLMINIIY